MRIVISLDKTGFDNDYVRSLLAAGAEEEEIVHLPKEAGATRRLLTGADGLLLGGGADIEPSRYGEPHRAENLELDAERDERELSAYAGARSAGLPVLAICRGLQLVNVARGGTLIQDLPTELPEGDVGHRVLPRNAPAHEILIDPGPSGEILQRCFPGGTARVNSRHHQAVARLAPDLTVAALAPDGVAEALSDRSGSHAFFLAVQWHPENLPPSSGHGEMFRLFVAACRRQESRGREAVPETAEAVR